MEIKLKNKCCKIKTKSSTTPHKLTGGIAGTRAILSVVLVVLGRHSLVWVLLVVSTPFSSCT